MKFASLHLKLTIHYFEPDDSNTSSPLWSKERFLAVILNVLPWNIAIFFPLSHKSYSGAFWVILSGWSLAYLLSLSVRHGSKLDQDWFPPRARTVCYWEGELLLCPYSVIRRRVLHVTGQRRCLILLFSRVYKHFSYTPHGTIWKGWFDDCVNYSQGLLMFKTCYYWMRACTLTEKWIIIARDFISLIQYK